MLMLRIALSWLWTVMHFAQNPQVRDREERRIKVTTAWAATAWDPTCPLRRFDCCSPAVHRVFDNLLVLGADILLVIVGIEWLVVQISEPISILRPCGFHVKRASWKIAIMSASTRVAPSSAEASHSVPSGSKLAIAIVLNDVKLHTDGAAIVLNVTIA